MEYEKTYRSINLHCVPLVKAQTSRPVHTKPTILEWGDEGDTGETKTTAEEPADALLEYAVNRTEPHGVREIMLLHNSWQYGQSTQTHRWAILSLGIGAECRKMTLCDDDKNKRMSTGGGKSQSRLHWVDDMMVKDKLSSNSIDWLEDNTVTLRKVWEFHDLEKLVKWWPGSTVYASQYSPYYTVRYVWYGESFEFRFRAPFFVRNNLTLSSGVP